MATWSRAATNRDRSARSGRAFLDRLALAVEQGAGRPAPLGREPQPHLPVAGPTAAGDGAGIHQPVDQPNARRLREAECELQRLAGGFAPPREERDRVARARVVERCGARHIVGAEVPGQRSQHVGAVAQFGQIGRTHRQLLLTTRPELCTMHT
jgi:hypothetical protein